jgi:hypothetical protein
MLIGRRSIYSLKLVLALLAGISTIGPSLRADALPTTVTISDLTGTVYEGGFVLGYLVGNMDIDGFRLTSPCHVHPAGLSNGPYISWDTDSCFEGSPLTNEFFPDDAFGSLFVDHFGHPFTAESVFLGAPASVVSSKGGIVSVNEFDEFFDLSGPEWTGIKWLVFSNCLCGAPSGGFTDLTLTVAPVPQSTALFLFAIGVSGFLVCRRRGGIRREE